MRDRLAGRRPLFVAEAPVMEHAVLVLQQAIGPDLAVAVLEAPRTAGRAQPGQFVHVRVEELPLRRPFSVYQAAGGRLEILYRIKGRGTTRMARWVSGADVDLVGPLGHGFAPPAAGERVVLVGGGIGVAPLVFYGARYPESCVAIAGFGTAAEVGVVERLVQVGVATQVTTVDGSAGPAGLVTAPLAAQLSADPSRIDRILACGPEPMLAAVARLAEQHDVPCEVALEREMACGTGVCLGCVAPTSDPEHPYLRVCTDGPVVPAERVRW